MFTPFTPQAIRALQLIKELQAPKMPEQQQPYDPAARMNELYRPQTEATDLYNRLLGETPEYQAPSRLRRFGAAVAGFGAGYQNPAAGIQVGYQAREQPNIERRERWNERLKSVEPAMQSERYYNTNARQAASSTIQAEIADRRLAESERAARAREENARIRAAAYAFKTTNPEWKFEEVPGGNFMWFPPPGVNEKPKDTGIKSGTLSDSEKHVLSQQGRIEAIKESGAQARENIETKAENDWVGPYIDKETNEPFMWNVKTNQTRRPTGIKGGITRPPLAAPPPKELTPTAQGVDRFNTAQDVAARYPKLAKYIFADRTGQVRITEPKWRGISKADYNMLAKEIFGVKYDVYPPDGSKPTPPSAAPANQGVRMRGPDGKIYVIPKDKVEQAKRDRMTVVE